MTAASNGTCLVSRLSCLAPAGQKHDDEQKTKARIARLSITQKLQLCPAGRLFQRVLSGPDPQPSGRGLRAYAVLLNLRRSEQPGTRRPFRSRLTAGLIVHADQHRGVHRWARHCTASTSRAIRSCSGRRPCPFCSRCGRCRGSDSRGRSRRCRISPNRGLSILPC